MPSDDGPNTIKERSSDKLDDKLSDKPDPYLAQIVAKRSTLPELIRAAIMALVKTA